MVANDRPASRLVPPARELAPQTASFAIAKFEISLIAGTGSATLAIALAAGRDEYVLDPAALASWAHASAQLLELTPAKAPGEQAEFRAPFLSDVEGRPAIAFEGAVTRDGVEYRLLVAGAAGRVGLACTDAETIRSVVDAARGAAAWSTANLGLPEQPRPAPATDSDAG